VPSNSRVNSVADRVKEYLAAHAGAGYCLSCIAGALELPAVGVRSASMWVRGFTGIRDTRGDACAGCGTTRRLVLTARHSFRKDM
jgi:hypothetical protein